MKPILEVQNLSVAFQNGKTKLTALRNVSFQIGEGEILGMVGESGSGKTVTCYSILGLLPRPPGIIEGGQAFFMGQDLLQQSRSQLRSFLGKKIGMIFQDPMTSLNPYLTIGAQLTEPLRIHEGTSDQTAKKAALQSLEEVGIADPKHRLDQYPHELSGGMRQRVMIAMALINKPQLLIADEPTTALDVTVQAQILELIRKKQAETGMSILFISHDLGVIGELAHRLLVLYGGQVMEQGPIENVFKDPLHPYTQALVRSLPKASSPLSPIPGAPPTLQSGPVNACPFAPRCTYALQSCFEQNPDVVTVQKQRETACLRVQEELFTQKKVAQGG